MRATVTKTLSAWYPNATIELKKLGGFNLEVWISKQEFETISYLERKQLLETVGSAWCDRFGDWKCPTMVVRDDKAGKDLATYHCLFRYARIEQE